MLTNNKTNHGLKFTWRHKLARKFDSRRFSRRKKFGAFLDISQIPDFDLAPTQPIYNQLASQMCTAFSNAVVSGIQEGIQLSPEYAYMKTNVLNGVKHSQGSDPVSAMKVHTKFGCLERKDSPYILDQNGIQGYQPFIENPDNWGISFDTPAAIHKKRSYMKCDQGKDVFDSILIAMYQSFQTFQNTKNSSDLRAVSVGFNWLNDFQWAPGGFIPNNTSQPASNGSGHNVVARGKKTINGSPYIIIQNSYGEMVGERGLYYFPRDVINKYVIFSDCFEDIDPNEAKQNQWNLVIRMLDALITSLSNFVNSLK